MSPAANQTRRGRVIEIFAVMMLGIATVGSAWCGYQATRWNGEESERARESSDLQVEAAREFGLATQTVSYDSNMVAQYARAVAEGNEELQQFYRDTLIRPDFLPVLDRWKARAESSEDAPSNLFEDKEYINGELSSYRETSARAAKLSAESDEAGENADDYVLTTLLLASALFFAGVTTSFRVRFAQLMLLAGSGFLLAYSAARLVDLPVA